MLATVLNSPVAVEASVRVVRAFVRLRELALQNRELTVRLEEIEHRVGKHDDELSALFEAVRQLLQTPDPGEKPEIGFHVREDAPEYAAGGKTQKPR